MKDLSRERIAELQKFPHNIQVEEIRPLLAMASRAVSESTLRHLSDSLQKRIDEPLAWSDFCDGAERDLRPSAEALARSAGEGKDG